ncbi:MAG TPA: NAD(P)-dependent oxidoreductase [Pirellulaceae bacterium]|nr:NAD(P)-dependent oxidoreductase [Pirellulaceae bacterium]
MSDPAAPVRHKAFPIGIVTSCRTLLIIGCGPETLQRVKDARRFDWHRIYLLSPDITPDVAEQLALDERATYLPRQATEEDIARSHVVVEDTEDETQAAQIAAWCRTHHVPLNAVDKIDYCDLYYMSLIFRGPLILGISSGGDAPAVASTLRKRLEATLTEGWTIAAEEMASLRKRLPGGQARKELLKSLVRDERFLAYIDAGNLDALRDYIRNAVDRI